MNKKIIKAIILTVLSTLLFLFVFGRMTFPVKALEFQVSLEPSIEGITEIHVSPLGSIRSNTHLSPLKINVNLLNVNVDILEQLISDAPSADELVNDIKKELNHTLYIYIVYLLFLGTLGGLLGTVLVYGKRIRAFLWGGIIGFFLTALLLGLTYSTYRVEHLRTPEFHGAIQSAPWAIELAQQAFQSFDLLGEQLKLVATNLVQLYERLDSIQPIVENPDDLLVLQVGDIHNNPAAQDFLLQIVKSFPVDIVIDTGDMTDFGTQIEGQLLKGLLKLDIPYLFVPGNHDSPEIIKELQKYRQVKVLTGGVVDVQGLKILALADPLSYSKDISPLSEEMLKKSQEKLVKLWEEAAVKPDLLAVHNIQLAKPLVGKVPLILYGHTHQYGIEIQNKTVLINAGTTGGAGLRGLQAEKEVPYSVILLHFQRNKENKLILTATDTIKVYNLEGGFILERKLFNENETDS